MTPSTTSPTATPKGEAGVRSSTRDYDPSDEPTSCCANEYDVHSVGIQEAPHVFELGHVGAGHEDLAVYANSFKCQTTARTLGKGNVLALHCTY